MILDNFIALFGAYFSSGIMNYAIIPFMLVAFVATVPCIIRAFWRH